MKNVPYRQVTGSLNWLATSTRPDIALAVSTVSRFNNNPGKQHWAAVKQILRYLKGTSQHGITLGGKELKLTLTGYSDADWAGDLDTRNSTTGYVFMLGSHPITWKSKLQNTTALSSMEAEYMALSAAAQEAMWIRKWLSNVGYEQSEPTTICEDNQGCIKFVHSTKFSPKTKHIATKHHFIRNAVKDKEINVNYCPTENMIADTFTKPLPRPTFVKHRDTMGMTRSLAQGGVSELSQ